MRQKSPSKGEQVVASAVGVRLVDVARHANVSISTVSRALSGHPEISEETRNSVLRAAETLGYDKRGKAGRKATGSRHLLVCAPNAGDLHIAHELVLRGIREYAEETGVTIMLVGDRFGEQKADRSLLSAANGVLFITPQGENDLMRRCQERRIPIAVTNRTPAHLAPASVDIAVHPDETEIARLVCSELQRLGHRRIAFAANGSNTLIYGKRMHAFKHTFAIYGLPVREDWFFTRIRSDADAMRRVFYDAPHVRPTVIVCATDTVALHLLPILQSLRLRVPEDVSVVGIHNIPFAANVTPSLSTVEVYLSEIGYETARQLHAYQLREPRRQVDVTLPIRWVERASTRYLSAEEAEGTRAGVFSSKGVVQSADSS